MKVHACAVSRWCIPVTQASWLFAAWNSPQCCEPLAYWLLLILLYVKSRWLKRFCWSSNKYLALFKKAIHALLTVCSNTFYTTFLFRCFLAFEARFVSSGVLHPSEVVHQGKHHLKLVISLQMFPWSPWTTCLQTRLKTQTEIDDARSTFWQKPLALHSCVFLRFFLRRLHHVVTSFSTLCNGNDNNHIQLLR